MVWPLRRLVLVPPYGAAANADPPRAPTSLSTPGACRDCRHRDRAARRLAPPARGGPPPGRPRHGGATFRIAAGDRVGLVGCNGAGKTTLTMVLAGAAAPAAGTVTSSGEVGYLPQDPRTGDLHVIARDRILSARGLDQILRDL